MKGHSPYKMDQRFDTQLSQIYEPIKFELAASDLLIRESLESKEEIISRLLSQINFGSGKRFLAALVFLSSKAVLQQKILLGDFSLLNHVASAFELLNMATIIHWDIIEKEKISEPSQNKPKISFEFWILFADYIISCAFKLATYVDNPQINSLFSSLFKSLCEGESKKLTLHRGLSLNEEQYLKLVKSSIALLFSSATKAGGVFVNAKEEELGQLQKYGLNLGLAYQIVDDCLELMSEEKERVGLKNKQVERKRPSWSMLRILSFLPSGEKKWLSQSFREDKNHKGFLKLKSLACSYRAIEIALKKAKGFIDEAKHTIGPLKDNEAKESLIALADYVLERLG